MDRHFRDMLQVLEQSGHVAVSETSLRCIPCSYVLNWNRIDCYIKRALIRHFQSKKHQNNKLIHHDLQVLSTNPWTISYSPQTSGSTICSFFESNSNSEDIRNSERDEIAEPDLEEPDIEEPDIEEPDIGEPENDGNDIEEPEINDIEEPETDEIEEPDVEIGQPDVRQPQRDGTENSPDQQENDPYWQELPDAIKKLPVLAALVRNVISRDNSSDDTPRCPHLPEVKDFFIQHALKYSASSAVDLASVLGGPSRSTIFKDKVPDATIPCWVSQDMIQNSLRVVNSLIKRLEPNTDLKNINCIICLDGTGTNSIIGSKTYPHLPYPVLIGLSHPMDEIWMLKHSYDPSSPDFSQDGFQVTVNGFESLKKLRLNKTISAAGEYLGIVIVPLMKYCVPYFLAAIPKGKKSLNMLGYSKLFSILQENCKTNGFTVISMVGDGDTSFRAYQKSGIYLRVPFSSVDPASILDTLEIRLQYCINEEGMFPAQDFLHAGKKLRNAVRALDTRILMFGSPKPENMCRWDNVYKLWTKSEDVKIISMKSSFDFKDKQDPSLVYDLAKVHHLFLEEGMFFQAIYFQAICFLYEAFIDKALSPEQRLFRVWFCRSLLELWKIWLTSKGFSLIIHFIDSKTFDDLVITCEGFVHYVIICVKTGRPFVPWFLSSDHNEQAYAYVRTGMFHGRRTNTDAARLLGGLQNRNRAAELIQPGKPLDKVSVAHTRSNTVLGALPGDPPHPSTEIISNRSFRDLFDVMEEATDAVKFLCNKRLIGVEYTDIDIDSILEYRILERMYALERSTLRANSRLHSDNDFHGSQNQQIVNVSGNPLHWDTAMAVMGNGGRMRMPGASRASRFFGYLTNQIQLATKCSDCAPKLTIGQKGTFIAVARVRSKQTSVTGKVKYLSYRKRDKGFNYPALSWCRHLSQRCTFWVYIKNSRTFTRCRIG